MSEGLLAPETADVYGNEDEDDGKEQHGQRCGFAEPEELEALLIDLNRGDEGPVGGAALGHRIDDCDAVQTPYQEKQRDGRQNGLELRQRNIANLFEKGRAVHPGRLVEAFR